MKLTVSSFCLLVLVGAIIVGCGGEPERETATDGASATDIEAYEAAIAEAEGMDDTDLEAEAGGDGE